MLTFKTFAEFKRLIRVGMRFQVTHHTHPHLSGHREISRVQGKALACWRTEPDGARMEAWCNYPPANEIRIEQGPEGSRLTFQVAGPPVHGNPSLKAAFTYHSFRELDAPIGHRSEAMRVDEPHDFDNAESAMMRVE